MGGSSSFNEAGIYGTQGVPDPENIPGGRQSAVTWKDHSGNIWLFGGLGLDANGASEFLNDLWKYSAGQWTWMGGSSVRSVGPSGVYGTKGVPASGNLPPVRAGAVGWTDASGNFWLFGGLGLDAAGNVGGLNDLWEYSAGQWTWIAGANVVKQPATYGVQGSPASDNTPGAVMDAFGWTDVAGISGFSVGNSAEAPSRRLMTCGSSAQVSGRG